MKVKYSPSVDALVIRFRDAEVETSDELRDGVIVDYDAGGRIVSIEILDATDMVDNPYSVEVEVAKETVVAA